VVLAKVRSKLPSTTSFEVLLHCGSVDLPKNFVDALCAIFFSPGSPQKFLGIGWRFNFLAYKPAKIFIQAMNGIRLADVLLLACFPTTIPNQMVSVSKAIVDAVDNLVVEYNTAKHLAVAEVVRSGVDVLSYKVERCTQINCNRTCVSITMTTMIVGDTHTTSPIVRLRVLFYPVDHHVPMVTVV